MKLYSHNLATRVYIVMKLVIIFLAISVHAWALNHFNCVQLFATWQTVAHQASLSLGFSMQEYWSGLPCPPPGDLPNPGVKPASLTSPALAGGLFTTRSPWEAPPHTQVDDKECLHIPGKPFTAPFLSSSASPSLRPSVHSVGRRIPCGHRGEGLEFSFHDLLPFKWLFPISSLWFFIIWLLEQP